jgi:hypothetical protein
VVETNDMKEHLPFLRGVRIYIEAYAFKKLKPFTVVLNSEFLVLYSISSKSKSEDILLTADN